MYFCYFVAVVAHSGLVNGLCFSRDGLHLVTSGSDECLRLWNIPTSRIVNVNYGRVPNDGARCRLLAYCGLTRPDLIFVPADNTILVLDVFTGKKVMTLRGHYNEVLCCVYHEQSQYLYSGASDHSVVVWVPKQDDIAAGKLSEETRCFNNQNIQSNIMADNWSDDD